MIQPNNKTEELAQILRDVCVNQKKVVKAEILSYRCESKTEEVNHLELGVEFTEPFRTNLSIPLVVALANVLEDDNLKISKYTGDGYTFYVKH
ncbi:hypothetical protein [Clostridium tertium]|uniref:hypothetical protein n=1 Tax=Clostridium tertium TaxID=1559 RepID=UPI0023B2FAD1|nr:hypothetical protein [Clostridium tertium]